MTTPGLTTHPHPGGQIAAAGPTAVLAGGRVDPESVFPSRLVRRVSA
ncbi:hypothetical protein [Micromonospora sp. NPDC049799]